MTTEARLELCVICDSDDEHGKLIPVRNNGLETLILFAKLRSHYGVLDNLTNSDKVFIHESCRRNFTNRRRTTLYLQEPETSKSFILICDMTDHVI